MMTMPCGPDLTAGTYYIRLREASKGEVLRDNCARLYGI